MEYHIYLNSELFGTTTDNAISFTELEPNTTYSLRVVALFEGEIKAFGDYDVTTMEPIEDNEPVDLD